MEWVAPISTFGVFIICLSLYNIANGKLKRIEDTKVSREVCQIVSKDLKEDITEIKNDVKEILRRNGG